jgi:hypothetical protein
MNRDQYLDMVDTQLRDARDNMDLIEKSYKEAKAKHDSILKFRNSYIEWLVGNKVDSEGK